MRVNKPQSKHDVRCYFLIQTGLLSNSNNNSNNIINRTFNWNYLKKNWDTFEKFELQDLS